MIFKKFYLFCHCRARYTEQTQDGCHFGGRDMENQNEIDIVW